MLSGRRKLLLADDSPTIQKVIKLTFEDEGMEVVAVSDGDEALRVLEEQRPDILLADVWMPGANGYELCERVKRDERLRHTPVVLLVGAFEPFNEAEARRVGADTVLTKPFQSIRDLVSKVGSLLGGEPKQEETPVEQPRREELTREASATRAESPAQHAESAAPVGASSGEQGETFHTDPASPLADLGADDELIEAKPAESFGVAARDAYSPERWQTADAREPFETSAHATAAEHKAQPSNQAQPAHSFAAPRNAGEGVLAAHGSFAARAAAATAADDTLLDLGQFEPHAASAGAGADDFVLDLEEDLHLPPQSAEREADVLDAPAPETLMQDEPQFFASPSVAHEVGSVPRGFVEPSVVPAEEPVSATVEDEYTDGSVEGDMPKEPVGFAAQPIEEATTAAAHEMAAHSTVAPPEPSTEGYTVGGARAGVEEPLRADQLSPEAIDAIARRVVELMSDKVVREIAWEVVPELAELLIKQRLDEERQK